MAATIRAAGPGGGGATGSSSAFFAIYDPRRYPAFDNAAFSPDSCLEPGSGGGGLQRMPCLRIHLPIGGDPASVAAAGAPVTAPATGGLDADNLDENSVLLEATAAAEAAAAAAAAAVPPQPKARWAAAATAAASASASVERRPTLLRLAEASAVKRDLAELLSAGLQRQRAEPQPQPQPQTQTPDRGAEGGAEGGGQLPPQSQLSRNPSVRHRSADWWRSAIVEHLNSRAGHHYFNGERDPSAVVRATVRGSLVSYRRGPRPEVIGHFDHHHQPHQPPPPPQVHQPTPAPPFRRADPLRQSTRM